MTYNETEKMKTKEPDLSVTMAVVNDFDGVYFTIQDIRNQHDCSNVEFVVVDNKPESPSSKLIKGFLDKIRRVTGGAQYIPLEMPRGTSPPRDLAIRSAKAPNVLHVDSHIGLRPGAWNSLLDYWKENPDSDDILSGPMVLDAFDIHYTHFDANWRSEMWGTWSLAWTCSCFSPSPYRKESGSPPLRFSIQFPVDGSSAEAFEKPAVFRALCMDLVPVTQCSRCGTGLPVCSLKDAEKVLAQNGYTKVGYRPGEPPFEIPGQGLGLFSVRRDSWLGFHEHSRGFGGEELYIHEKYRQAGRRAICIPDLKWFHRYGRQDGVQYPLTRYLKIRNYVLEFEELGMDLEPIHTHFVKNKKVGFSQEHWDHLIADPVAHELEPGREKPTYVSVPVPDRQTNLKTVQDLLDWLKTMPERDFTPHSKAIVDYARKCEHVTEISKQRESAILLARGCVTVLSYNAEYADPVLRALNHMSPGVNLHPHSVVDTIPETDLLLLDGVKTKAAVLADLAKHVSKVRRFVIIHGSKTYSEMGEDGQKGGVRTAMREFMRKHPEWSVIHHSEDKQGLTVLARQDQDKPKLPSVIQMAGNFADSMIKFVGGGAKLVSKEAYQARLEVCSLCPQRNNNRCAVCGCNLAAKAQLKADGCPLMLWPDQRSTQPQDGTIVEGYVVQPAPRIEGGAQ